jgi:hypothetical protein
MNGTDLVSCETGGLEKAAPTICAEVRQTDFDV